MKQIYEGQEFRPFYDRDSGRIFSDLEFRKCRFISCAISITLNPKLRSTVRKIRLSNCSTLGCTLYSAIVEDVTVENLKTNNLLQAWGAVYKHVTLKGKIGRIMISPFVTPAIATPQQQQEFNEANAKFYSSVDWALDISEAEFEEGEIQGIPASLIRRDPVTQVVVTREKAMQGLWRQIDLSKTHWATSIEFLLNRGNPDVVLVAPKRHRNYLQLLDGLNALRDAGIAEPN